MDWIELDLTIFQDMLQCSLLFVVGGQSSGRDPQMGEGGLQESPLVL
jgi:hypothetical protein